MSTATTAAFELRPTRPATIAATGARSENAVDDEIGGCRTCGELGRGHGLGLELDRAGRERGAEALLVHATRGANELDARPADRQRRRGEQRVAAVVAAAHEHDDAGVGRREARVAEDPFALARERGRSARHERLARGEVRCLRLADLPCRVALHHEPIMARLWSTR
jgi:hypothetical protein